MLKLPDVLAQSLPVATLFGMLLSLSRLAKDGEIAALGAGGVKRSRLLMPFIVIGSIVGLVTFCTTESVVPYTNHEFQNILRSILLEDTMPTLEENVFLRAGGDRFFYMEKVDSRTHEMQNVMIYETHKAGTPPRIITARAARMDAGVLRLSDGIIHEFGPEGYVDYEVKFKEMDVRMDQNLENFFGEQKTPSEMSRKELGDNIALFRKSGIKVDALVVDYQLKLALPFASLIFVLVGSGFVTRQAKSGRLWGAAASTGVALAYYLLASLSRSLGCNGNLPPFVAAWGPNLLLGCTGVVLIYWNDRRI